MSSRETNGDKQVVRKDPLLTEVGNFCYTQFRKAQAKVVDSERIGLHVSDYIKDCARNVAYLQMAGTSGIDFMDTETMDVFYVGKIYHANSNLQGLANELAFCYDIPKDKAVKFDKDGKPEGMKYDKAGKAIGIDGRPLIDFVFGALDDLVIHPAIGNIIVDKKTYTFKGYEPKKPYDHHVAQINLYRLLLNKCKKIDATYGCNLYIEKGGSGRIWRFPYRLAEISSTLKYLRDKYAILKKWYDTKELPERTINWMCDGYCPVAKQCFMDFP